ncbi:MAG: hypothetical protein LBI48_00540 [Burkholderiaceae bacterium]|jgi:hypothetical protein|nr:hypothetical protein [Burkholderiaceae bacterium]
MNLAADRKSGIVDFAAGCPSVVSARVAPAACGPAFGISLIPNRHSFDLRQIFMNFGPILPAQLVEKSVETLYSIKFFEA